MAKAVTIVAAGGVGVTNLGSLSGFGTPMTPVDAGGMAVTLLDAGGLPVVLINEDGTLWSAESLVSAIALAAGGALFNPSDLTSLYQSRTGGSNSTSGSVVGIMLDKSYMGGQTAAAYIAGRPELRGTGAIGITGIATAATYNTSTGAGTVARVDLSNQSYVEFTGLSGSYLITVTCTSGTMLVRAGTVTGTTLATITSGSTTPVFVASGGNRITITNTTSTGSAAFTVDALKAIPGFHALAPSDAARPTVTVSGGLGYLTADGVDDWMNVTPTLNLGEAWWHVGGWRSDTNSRNAFSISSASGTASLYDGSTSWAWYNGATEVPVATGSPDAIAVVTVQQTSVSALAGRYNGGNSLSITPYDDVGTPGLALFSNRNTAWNFGIAGRFYGGAFAPGALSTENRALAERLVAQWAGVTL